MSGLVLVTVLHTFPFVFLLASSALQSVDASYEEAAQILGAGKLRTALLVTLPLIAPAILAGTLLAFVNAIALFGSQAILGLPGRIVTLPTRIYALFDYPPQYGLASALSLLFILITVAALYLQHRFLARRSYVTVGGKGARSQLIDLGPLRWLLFGFCVLVFVVAIVLPYGALIAVSLSKSWGLSFWKDLTLANYRFVLFEYNVTQRAILNSLLLATLAATIAVLLGAVIGWIDVRTKAPGRRLLDYAALVPLGLPGIVMAVALIQFWLTMPIALYGTLAILLLAYVGRYIPLGVRAANTSLRQIDPSLEESARVLGASWGRTLARDHAAAHSPRPVRGLAAGVRAGDPGAERLDPAVQLQLHHARGSRLQPLRDGLHGAGGGARHGQHGHHQHGPAGCELACVRQAACVPPAEAPLGQEQRPDGRRSPSAACPRATAADAGLAAVSDLSLDIADNQFVTLLGPSGCGKTTTLRLIAGFIAPDAGTIHADDRLVSSAEQRGAAGGARHGHGVPELCGVAAQDGVREHRLRPEAARVAGARGARAGQECAGAGQPDGA